MKKFIHTVTVTGADDSLNNFEDLIKIYEKYPYVEFGILLSKTSMGSNRFPGERWLLNASEKYKNKLKFSGHICGRWVKEILNGTWTINELKLIHNELPNLFSRWQLNTHGILHEFNKEKILYVLNDELDIKNKEVIIQYDKTNIELLKFLTEKDLNISTLYDLSHGSGRLPDTWETPVIDCKWGVCWGIIS